MARQKQHQVLALAGILQSMYCVDKIAQSGRILKADIEPLLRSLFIFDAEETIEIYGNVNNLKTGLQLLIDLCESRFSREHKQVLRYAINVIYLEKHLSKKPEMQEIIHSRLSHTAYNIEHFQPELDATAKRIAGLYQDTLSTLSFRIQVTGSMQELQNNANAEMIRALILAAVRSAMLWRQLGGKRYHFLLSKQRLSQQAAAQLDAV